MKTRSCRSRDYSGADTKSCARYERSSKLYEVVVHRDFCLRASPHKESRPLLKCSWERRAPFRRPDACAEGARNTPEGMGFTSRLEISSQQNFPQHKPTGLDVVSTRFEFSSRSGRFWPPSAQNVPKAARKLPPAANPTTKTGRLGQILINFS